MATATRKKKTAAELKKELEAAKKRVAALEAKAYEGELAEAIAASNIVSEFDKIKAKYKDIPPVNILQAVGKAVKIARVVVTQSEAKLRAAKKTTK
jgi:hypothetical protein